MSNQTIGAYCEKLWEDELRHAAPWARDQIGWGIVVLIAPFLLAFFVLGRHIDWPLLWTSLIFYLIAFIIYGGVQFVRAAWKCDLARQEQIAAQDVLLKEKEREFAQMVASKDSEFKASKLEWVEQYRTMEVAKNKEREAVEVVLRDYKAVWGELQSRSRQLAIDLREYCELTPVPSPPLIAGQPDTDYYARKAALQLPWMEKVTFEYQKRFADRVSDLRDEFAMQGHKDFKLDGIIRTGVVHTDTVMEVCDRLMGLALRELAKRQLRTLTLKQLCCD